MAFAEKALDGQLSGTTAVDIVPAPASAHTTVVRNVTIHNRDTAAVTVILQYVNGASARRLVKQTLSADQSLIFDSVVVLDGTSKKVQAVMTAAPATTQPDYAVAYGDVS